MMARMPDGGRSPLIVRHLAYAEDYDLYDVLADVGYGQAPKIRVDRGQRLRIQESTLAFQYASAHR